MITARDDKKSIAVFASGNGGNFEAIAQACLDGRIDAHVSLLVCDKPGAYVCERARRLGVDTFAFNPREYASKSEYEKEIIGRLDGKKVELICLAGYMRIISEVLLGAYGGRIMNIHPSLLPAFKGAHAIRDAFEYGVKVYGVTIHLVDDTLDGGKILSQKAFHYGGRNIDKVEEKIHAIEHELYIETIKSFLRKAAKQL